ncbi:MAG TPA: ABC transporter substrate-binding protein [Gaiellaceae bacterium]|nr:ABC transporter substrate-binding protein [Gaiellaceae bacterium]
MRKLVGVCLVVALGLGVPAAASSTPKLTHVTFVYNFAPGGYDANLVAAQDHGFFKAQGLDVSFVVPATGADPAKLIASGKADIGLIHSTDVILDRDKGLPLVSLGATHQYGTLEALCPASKGVKTLRDLEGKTYGLTGIPADRVMFEQMLKLNGIPESKLKIVVAGFAGVPQLLAGRIDCYEAISWYEPILYDLELKKSPNDTSTYTEIPYYKHKIPRFYTFGLATSQSYLSGHRDLVRHFMTAWSKATQWAIANPAAATDLLVKRYPSLDKTSSLAIWKASARVVTSPETKAHCLGWQSPSVWQAQVQFLLRNKLISKPVSVSQAMTNAFLPCG